MTKRALNFKLVLLGDSAVGKSSTVTRFVKDTFSDMQQPTIGASFLTQTLTLDDGQQVMLDIWDTAGQERYRSLAPMYYRGAAAALIVYDITSKESFNGAKEWIKELQLQEEIVLVLAGNKVDLGSKRDVTQTEAKSYADETGCMFFEISAKSGENIRNMFHSMAKKLPKPVPRPSPSGDTIFTMAEPPRNDPKCCKG